MDTDTWQLTLEQLKLQMTQATFDTWLHDSTASLCGSTLTVTTKNAYAKDWLQNRLAATIKRTAARVYGKPLDLAFTVEHQPKTSRSEREFAGAPAAIGPGAATSRPGEEEEAAGEEEDTNEPPSTRFAIRLIGFDPTIGYVQVTNYELQFWQPLLGNPAFVLWCTLKSFPAAWDPKIRPEWPSIQTLADTCAQGNRQKILGRKQRPGHARMIGALEVLERERIVWTTRWGEGRETVYTFNVVDHLPMLTPAQAQLLTPRLQERHARRLAQAHANFEEWKQLTFSTLAPEEPDH